MLSCRASVCLAGRICNRLKTRLISAQSAAAESQEPSSCQNVCGRQHSSARRLSRSLTNCPGYDHGGSIGDTWAAWVVASAEFESVTFRAEMSLNQAKMQQKMDRVSLSCP